MGANNKTVYDGVTRIPENSGATIPEYDGATVFEGTLAEAAISGAAEHKEKTYSNDDIQKDRVLLDTYRVDSDAIHGGMGSVWRVHHQNWNVDLAMKRPQAKLFANETQKANFIRECEAWINLGLHPNIVSCYYVRELGGVPTIFSEWMENGSLENRIQDGSVYESTEEEVQKRLLDIAIQFARGLHYAHEAGLLHQDVKPDNLLLTKGWDAKVADFGLARARALLTVLDGAATQLEGDPGATAMAPSGGYTPAYCSMEQMDGKPLTRRTDIYSWAVSVMELYLGNRPWSNGVVAGLSCQEYFENCRVSMPERLKKLLARCMAADPEERYHDFHRVEVALKEIYCMETGDEYPRPESKAAADTADSLNNRALSYLDLGRKKEAEALWRRALQVESSHVRSLCNLVLYFWAEGYITIRDTQQALLTVQQQEDCREWVDEFTSLLAQDVVFSDNAPFFQRAPKMCVNPCEAAVIDSKVICFTFIPDAIAVFRYDTMTKSWEEETIPLPSAVKGFHLEKLFVNGARTQCALCLSSPRKHIYLLLYEIKSWNLLRLVKAGEMSLLWAEYSPDDEYILLKEHFPTSQKEPNRLIRLRDGVIINMERQIEKFSGHHDLWCKIRRKTIEDVTGKVKYVQGWARYTLSDKGWAQTSEFYENWQAVQAFERKQGEFYSPQMQMINKILTQYDTIWLETQTWSYTWAVHDAQSELLYVSDRKSSTREGGAIDVWDLKNGRNIATVNADLGWINTCILDYHNGDAILATMDRVSAYYSFIWRFIRMPQLTRAQDRPLPFKLSTIESTAKHMTAEREILLCETRMEQALQAGKLALAVQEYHSALKKQSSENVQLVNRMYERLLPLAQRASVRKIKKISGVRLGSDEEFLPTEKQRITEDMQLLLIDGSIVQAKYIGTSVRRFAEGRVIDYTCIPPCKLRTTAANSDLKAVYIGRTETLYNHKERGRHLLVSADKSDAFCWEDEQIPIHAAFSPDGRFLCVLGYSGLILVDVQKYSIVYREKRTERTNDIMTAFSPNGRYLYIYDVLNRSEPRPLIECTYEVFYDLEAPGYRR